MVYDNISYRVAAQRVISVKHVGLTAPESHIPHHDIMGVDVCRAPGDANPVTWSCLAGNGQIRGADMDRTLQADQSGNIKHERARSGGFTTFAKSTRPAVGQIG